MHICNQKLKSLSYHSYTMYIHVYIYIYTHGSCSNCHYETNGALSQFDIRTVS